MEVDRIMRVIHGDDEALNITPRNQRNIVTNHATDTEEQNSGSEISGTEKIVVDPKRCRLDMGTKNTGNRPKVMHADGPQLEMGSTQIKDIKNNDPKHLIVAGSGHQARVAL